MPDAGESIATVTHTSLPTARKLQIGHGSQRGPNRSNLLLYNALGEPEEGLEPPTR